jgi:uncharacterized membrane protein
MTTHAIAGRAPSSLGAPNTGSIGLGEPFRWLGLGLRDFRSAPWHSLFYGALFAAACLAAYGLAKALPWFAFAFFTGLLILGPYVAVGLYAANRQLEKGEPVEIRSALRLLSERKTNLALFALMVGLLAAAWVRLSALIFAIKFDLFSPTIEGYLGVLSGGGDPVVLAYVAIISLALAAALFFGGAISVPSIVDRDANPFSAIAESASAVARHWPAMLVWAILVATSIAIGVATFFLAFVVLFPVLGYATWHSYRALTR